MAVWHKSDWGLAYAITILNNIDKLTVVLVSSPLSSDPLTTKVQIPLAPSRRRLEYIIAISRVTLKYKTVEPYYMQGSNPLGPIKIK